MHGKQFYSPAEIAKELGVSSTTVLRLVHAGRLPALRVSERILRIPAASFERYKAGTLEAPFEAAIGPVKQRPRFGADERIRGTMPDQGTGRARAAARSR